MTSHSSAAAPQATRVAYNKFEGSLTLTTVAGVTYHITDPGHAARIYEKIGDLGELTDVQADWLERYRIPVTDTTAQQRGNLRAMLAKLRTEIRTRSRPILPVAPDAKSQR